MTPETKEYLAAASNVLAIFTTGLESIQAGTATANSAQLAVRTLKAKAREARTLADNPHAPADEKRLIRAMADDMDKLRAIARWLC